MPDATGLELTAQELRAAHGDDAVVATQFFLSGLKFLLYHKWVFPVPKEDA